MSTSLVLGVVGAVVGSFVPGVGTAAGFAVGSAIGGAVDASKQRITNEGPRLGELKVQASQYGGAISRLYGTTRIAGNVIASTNIIEHENRTSSRQGKGGPKVTNVEYTYTVDMAVGLCEGEITGIRRIWANGKVVYDASESATGGAIIASAQLAESITVYPGTETQLPDPTLEAYLGTGNVPAYRGLAYVVFNDLQVTDFGGRVPQLEFEIVKAGDPEPRLIFGTSGDALAPGWVSGLKIIAPTISVDGDDTLFFRNAEVVPPVGNSYMRIDVFAVSMDGVRRINGFDIPEQAYNRQPLFGYSDLPGAVYRKVDPDDELETGINVFIDEAGIKREFLVGEVLAYGQTSSHWAKRGERLIVVGDQNLLWGRSAVLFDFSSPTPLGQVDLDPSLPIIDTALLSDSHAWLVLRDTVNDLFHIQVRSIDDLTLEDEFDLPAEYTSDLTLSMGVNDDDTLCLWTENPSLGVDYSELLKIHADGSVDVLASEDDAAFGPNATHSVVGANWSTTKYINVRGRTLFGAKGTYPVDGPDVQLYVASFDTLAVRGVPLADIIAAETALCDVDPADLDVTDCTEEVMGYAVARVATTRANLEPLLTANRRDVVESEWQLKFPQRGSAPILTIPYEDLGAEEAEISQAEPLATTRAQELDLPRTVLVNYINAGQDYQGGTEPSRRLITRAQKELAVDVAVVMTPDQAAQVADAIMYDTWTARTARSISVLRKYSQMESGDVFNVIDRTGNTLRLRAVEAEYAGPVIKLNTVEDDPTVNTQTSTGAVVGVPQTASGLPPATFVDFLDIPILQDADDNAGMYVALRGTRPTDWQGAVFSRESEDGSLSNVGTVRNSATVGVTEEALPDWTGGNVFDETSSVLITLYSGELESVSREAVLDGTLNALLIGSEIVQACDMTFVSGDTWRVSRMLRGRRGTEWAQTGHAVGERVVLLGFAGMLRPVLTPVELNIEQPYAVQSIGRTTITRYSATNTGIGLKPFAVVDLRRDGDAFEWHRRTRLQHRFLTPDINPLLGEQSEAYDVVLTNSGGTVLESATVSVPAWDPATALSAGDVLTVYQRSASVGRGYPTSLTV